MDVSMLRIAVYPDPTPARSDVNECREADGYIGLGLPLVGKE